MNTFVHISDLHFGREIPAVIDGLLDILYETKPELVIISGDLTQRAKTEEYQAGSQFLRQLPFPYIIVPGNHDLSATHLPERFFYPWDKWHQYVSHKLEPVVRTADYIAVGINTARAAGWYFDWSRGRVNEDQATRVQQIFQGVNDTTLRMVVAHHPFWLPDDYEHRDVVQGRDEAMQAFQQAGVDIILSGHIHLPYTRLLHGMIISHAGTTFSNRVLDNYNNSFNIIRGDRQRLEVDFMEWKSPAFELAGHQSFQRLTGVWQTVST